MKCHALNHAEHNLFNHLIINACHPRFKNHSIANRYYFCTDLRSSCKALPFCAKILAYLVYRAGSFALTKKGKNPDVTMLDSKL